VIEADYLSGPAQKDYCQTLARYFNALPTFPQPDDRTVTHPRKLAELPYLQTRAQDWSTLETTLTDLDFIEAKFRAGMGIDLQNDYRRLGLDASQPGPVVRPFWRWNDKPGVQCPHCLATSPLKQTDHSQVVTCPACQHPIRLPTFVLDVEWQPRGAQQPFEPTQPDSSPCSPTVAEFADFASLEARHLMRHPELTFQRAANQPPGALSRSAYSRVENGQVPDAWLERLNKPKVLPPRQRTLSLNLAHGDEPPVEMIFLPAPDGSQLNLIR
jgi:hypothetical protein